eukprot:5214197-Pyramimonas_sp.AAC.2
MDQGTSCTTGTVRLTPVSHMVRCVLASVGSLVREPEARASRVLPQVSAQQDISDKTHRNSSISELFYGERFICVDASQKMMDYTYSTERIPP